MAIVPDAGTFSVLVFSRSQSELTLARAAVHSLTFQMRYTVILGCKIRTARTLSSHVLPSQLSGMYVLRPISEQHARIYDFQGVSLWVAARQL